MAENNVRVLRINRISAANLLMAKNSVLRMNGISAANSFTL